jgi:hypothetical protein
VTVDLGANDVLPLINTRSCTLTADYTQTLTTMDANIVSSLTHLQAALQGTGDLVMMNYYFPFQNSCPNLVPDAQLPTATWPPTRTSGACPSPMSSVRSAARRRPTPISVP